jgi:hypothetical protein
MSDPDWLYQPENVEYRPEPKWLEAARFTKRSRTA